MPPRRRKTPSRRQIEDRNSPRYLKMRDRFRARCQEIGACCHLCGQYVDYDIPAGEVDSFEVDHFYPVLTHPEMYEDPANFRASHKQCNSQRGAADVKPTLGQLSEAW